MLNSFVRFSLVGCALLGTSLVSFRASADDDVAKGTLGGDTASKGNSDITSTGFQAGTNIADAKGKDATEWALTFGALYVSGNAQLLAITGGSTFRLRRGSDQLSAAAAVNYSEASTPPATATTPAGPTTTTVDNQQGKIRYDRFFTENFAGFLGVQARRDRFIGVDLRLQVDPGVSYYLVNEKRTQFWGELGYDFLYDIRRDDSLTQADGTKLDKTASVHSARAFVGFKEKWNDDVALTAGLEFLQGLSNTNIQRLGGDFALTSKLAKRLALATAFSFRYDSQPLPGKQNIDTTTSLNLVVTLL
jgi:putative salt-induced outer membrane protein YdiY